ncbi:family 20 glycosylhydrolase [Populibacterium corticicola]|uniref:beta-N-acetylhexosaminidase n=1 Tax=Populibacterium corticicola TaxID=1812826 RepID=A0ABW5XHB6_9MICO
MTSHTFAQLALQLDPWAAGASAKAKAVSLPIPGTEERDYTVSVTQDSSLAPESFSLSVTAGAIDLKAADARGALYAVNALIQAHNTPDLEYFEATSSPRYPVRGFSFDIARHFYTPAQIMQVIDIIAGYNINRLHLHLTDDQGWRIEIDGRQELTKIAAENDTSGGKGGYLTFSDYEDIQDYAALYGIEVVPEVDLPGHTNALLVAYPEISPDRKPRQHYCGTDVGFSWIDLTSDKTWEVLDDIIGSLARRTRSEYLHIGGDEVHQVGREEYEKFMSRLAELVTKHGKKVVAWHETAGATVPEGTQLQFWTAKFNTDNVAKLVNDPNVMVIASPAPHTYFDLRPEDDFHIGVDWAGLLPLRNTFEWEPQEAVPVPNSKIIGVEAAIWTEVIPTFEGLTALILPRIAGVASVAWGSPRIYDEFTASLPSHGRVWAEQGYEFYRSPDVNWD